MGRVLSNNVAVAYCIESALGVPVTTWKLLEPNSLKKWGNDTKIMARNPINANRNRQKGAVVDLDSGVEIEADLTMESFLDFCEGFLFAVFKGITVFNPTAVTATGYTVASGGAIPNGYLVYARGFLNTANNGLKLLAGTSIGTEIKTTGLVVEAAIPATQHATVEICGIQGAATDLSIDASGNLVTAALDFTALTGITLLPGAFMFVGGLSTNAALNFATAADRGYARIKTVAALKLTLDKKATTFAADVGTGKTVQIFFGRFARNVAATHADYVEKSYTFEAAFKNLATPGPGDEYEYSRGNYANTLELDLPLTELAKASFGFTGQITDNPTGARLTGASAPVVPIQKAGMATASQITRLRMTEVDETGITTDFKDVKVKINNNVGGEKVLGTLGPKYLNTGNFEVDIDTDIVFTNSGLVTAVRANRTVTMDFEIHSGDGAIFVDIPSMTLGDGAKDMPENESVRIKIAAQAIQDDVLGYSLGVTAFPFIPS